MSNNAAGVWLIGLVLFFFIGLPVTVGTISEAIQGVFVVCGE